MKCTRRDFFKLNLFSLLSLSLLQNVALAAKEKMVDIKSTKAKKYSYAFPKDQKKVCKNCSLYTKLDEHSGKCPIFAGERVHSIAYCSSWIKRD